jgi:hypothetical protein
MDPLVGLEAKLPVVDLFRYPPEMLAQMDKERADFDRLVKEGRIREAAFAQPTLFENLGMNMLGAGVTVFHGGPSRWLAEKGFPKGRPRRDLSGTGVGGQAFGHGFYAAEAPGVAKTYQQAGVRTIPGAFTGGSKYQVVGAEFPKGRVGHKALDTGYDIEGYLYHRMTGTSPEMETYLRGQIDRRMAAWRDQEKGRGGIANEHMQELSDFWDIHARNAAPSKIKESSGGVLYKLDVPDEDATRMLDWDAPLSKQPENVLRLIDKIGGVVKAKQRRGEIDEILKTKFGRDLMNPDAETKALLAEYNKIGPTRFGDTGESLYLYIQNEMAQNVRGSLKAMEAASEALRKAGIPGLKYFDQFSRPGQKGSRNYVVWDQEVLDRTKVLESYVDEMIPELGYAHGGSVEKPVFRGVGHFMKNPVQSLVMGV